MIFYGQNQNILIEELVNSCRENEGKTPFGIIHHSVLTPSKKSTPLQQNVHAIQTTAKDPKLMPFCSFVCIYLFFGLKPTLVVIFDPDMFAVKNCFSKLLCVLQYMQCFSLVMMFCGSVNVSMRPNVYDVGTSSVANVHVQLEYEFKYWNVM